VDIYQVPECRTLIRGTYRYPGWAALMRALVAMDFLSLEPAQPPIGGLSFHALLLNHILPKAGTATDAALPLKAQVAAALSDGPLNRL
jgi:saccharopine dehydrogenase-like NADP-dependent oxidoreductase